MLALLPFNEKFENPL